MRGGLFQSTTIVLSLSYEQIVLPIPLYPPQSYNVIFFGFRICDLDNVPVDILTLDIGGSH